MYDHNSQASDGTIDSPNLTENQYKYAEVISQLTKIALFVSLRHSKFRVEAPDGYNKMIKAIQADGKSYDTLTPIEKEQYEAMFRYETHIGQRLGNVSSILQQILHEAHRDDEIRDIFNDCLKDIKISASKASTEYIEKKNKVEPK